MAKIEAVPVELNADVWRAYQQGERARLAADGQRSAYHLQAPSGWMNDPNGIIHWRGQYHVFYQYNPHAARWGPPYWGHAVSNDLVSWRDLPPALAPQMEPADEGGCWSGCAVNDNGTPTFLYTGVVGTNLGEQTTCLAFGEAQLEVWHKYDANPIVRAPKELAITQNAYRDPYVWQEGDIWYQVIATSVDDRGQALLYRSQDLRSWDYLQPLLSQEVRDALTDEGHTWECPNFFALGDKFVLIVSLSGECLTYPVAFIGAYREGQFYPETMQRLDWGYHCFYAPLSMQDEQGRRLMWGWLQEQRSPKAQLRAGWSGVMSVPRVLTLEQGVLLQTPAPELERLRQQHFTLSAGQPLELTGSACDLDLRSSWKSGSLHVLDSTGQEAAVLSYNADDQTLTLRCAGEHIELAGQAWQCPLDQQADTLDLRVFIDGSTLEVFAPRGVCLSARFYTDAPAGLRLEWQGVGLVSAAVWALDNIWAG